MKRSASLHARAHILAAFFAIALALTCDSPQNPYRQPENVNLSANLLAPTDSVYRVYDTVSVRIAVHLPYLINGPLAVSAGADTQTVALPNDEGVVDHEATVRFVFVVPDTYQIVVTGVRDDGVALSRSLRVVVAGRPPRVVAQSPDTVAAAEGTACSLWVAATGTGVLAYRWLKGGIPTTESSSVMRFDSVVFTDGGIYRCVVSSMWGADTSALMVLSVKPPDWIAPPGNLRVLRRDSVLIVAWDHVLRAERYRVYYYDTAYAANAPYTEVGTTFYETDTVRVGAYVWVRAVAGSTVSGPSATLRVRRLGPCVVVPAGASLNRAIREASVGTNRPQMLCPVEGFYEQNTVWVSGVVKVLIE